MYYRKTSGKGEEDLKLGLIAEAHRDEKSSGCGRQGSNKNLCKENVKPARKKTLIR